MKAHSGTLERSVRLNKMLCMLQDHADHTTFELSFKANDMAVHSTIADLRKNGKNISCKYSHMTEDRRKVYNYRLDAE